MLLLLRLWRVKPAGLISRVFACAFVCLTFLTVVFAHTGLTSLTAHSQELPKWSPNHRAKAMVSAQGKTYITGPFAHLTASIGSMASFDLATGVRTPSLGAIDANIYAVIADGQGGWYVAGDFAKIAGLNIGQIARISAAGEVIQSFNARINPIVITALNYENSSAVTTMLLQGGVLYIGGYFQEIQGQQRVSIAALDAQTGNLLPWSPLAASVYQLLSDGEHIIALMGFGPVAFGERTIAGFSVTSINATSGAINWTRNLLNGTRPINSIAVHQGHVIVGGSFQTQDWVGGTGPNCLGKINSVTGALENWNHGLPDCQTITSVAAHGSRIFVIGRGSNYAPLVRAVDFASGSLTSWSPIFSGPDNNYSESTRFREVKLINSNVFISAQTNYPPAPGGVEAERSLLAFDSTSGAQIALNYPVRGRIADFAVSGGVLGVVGRWLETGAVATRPGLAVVDTRTLELDSFSPPFTVAGGDVSTMALHNGTLYVAGSFTSINGQNRSRLAALDLNTGTLLPWNPAVDNSVSSLTVDGNDLYATGDFGNINGIQRSRIARFDLITGALSSWNLNAHNLFVIRKLAIHGDAVFLVGAFVLYAGGERYDEFAAFRRDTGTLLPQFRASLGPDDTWKSVVIADSRVLLGGTRFNDSNSIIKVLDASSGVFLEEIGELFESWNQTPDRTAFTLHDLYVAGDKVYVTGYALSSYFEAQISRLDRSTLDLVDRQVLRLNYFNRLISGDLTIRVPVMSGSSSVVAGGLFDASSELPGRNLGILSDRIYLARPASAPLGTALDGQMLTANDQGTFRGRNTISTERSWTRCNSIGENCTAINGSQNVSSYTTTNQDVGKRLRLKVTASNSDGQVKALSWATEVVAPRSSGSPTISGNLTVGAILTGQSGPWNGVNLADLQLSYEWSRCDISGANCSIIGSAQGNTYTLSTIDSGRRIGLRVAASASGSAFSFSSMALTGTIIPGATPSPTTTPIRTPTPTRTPTMSPTPTPRITPSATSTPGASSTHTPTPRVTPSATSTSSSASTPTISPSPSPTLAPLVPIVECVETLSDGSLLAHFGYYSNTEITVTVPVGDSNRFVPAPEDRGQPSAFISGRVSDLFVVSFPSEVTWLLAGDSATANAQSPKCCDAAICEACVYTNNENSLTTLESVHAALISQHTRWSRAIKKIAGNNSQAADKVRKLNRRLKKESELAQKTRDTFPLIAAQCSACAQVDLSTHLRTLRGNMNRLRRVVQSELSLVRKLSQSKPVSRDLMTQISRALHEIKSIRQTTARVLSQLATSNSDCSQKNTD